MTPTKSAWDRVNNINNYCFYCGYIPPHRENCPIEKKLEARQRLINYLIGNNLLVKDDNYEI